jgi:DNA invertase Pin-like site-specific DNA recombinase
MLSAVAEFERELMLERQKEGVEQAKKAGKYKGRVKKYTEKHAGMNHALELYQTGKYTVKQICEITKVSRSALYRELNERERVT